MTISILSLCSGSGGNCYRASDGATSLLIECGIPIKKIKQGLNFKLSEVAGCLVSHSHGDHSKAVHDLLKFGIDCYMSPGCSTALGLHDDRRCTWMYRDELYKIGSFFVYPFPTVHDSAAQMTGDTLGFYIKSTDTGECLVFATDTAYLLNRFSRIDYLMIECNYDLASLDESLNSGRIVQSQYNRIIATHFGLDNVVEFLKANDLLNLKEIYLLHLSSANSNEELILKSIRGLTGVPVVCCKE
jgi:phosphoribosyl 1,2-cyclic phosphodiesterase